MSNIKINVITEGRTPLFKKTGVETAYKELCGVLRSLGVEIVLNSHEKCDLTHIHTTGPHGMYWVNKSKVPVVITAHTVPQEIPHLYKLGSVFEKIYRKYIVNFYSKAHLIVAPTNFTRGMIQQLKIGKPIEVISNGVNLEKFRFNQEKREEFRKKYNIAPNDKVIYSAGLMSSRKGLDKFISIAKKMKNYKFSWIGRKPLFLQKGYGSDLRRVKNAPNNFVKTGYVKDIVAAHCGGDVFLFPSRFETQGIVALEAAACSRPLVVENIPSFEWLDKSCLRASTIDEYCAQIEKTMNNINFQRDTDILLKKNDIVNTGKSMIKIYDRVLSGYY